MTLHKTWTVFNGSICTTDDVIVEKGLRRAVAFILHMGDPKLGDLFIFSWFFKGASNKPNALSLELSQQIVIIHESVHLAGMKDKEFDPNKKDSTIGSRELTNLIIHSCHSRLKSYMDLDFEIPGN